MVYISLYVVISTIVAAILSRGQKERFLFCIVLVIGLPIVGWFIPSIWPKRWLKHDPHFFADYLNNQSSDIEIELLQTQQHVQKDHELNIVPVEEALLVNDYHTRRKVLIDIVKQDAMQFIDVLKTAVTNEDSETSHYAVTAVIEVKRELTILLQKLAVEFSQQPEDIDVALTYADVVQAYIRSGFLDARSLKQYYVLYTDIVARLIAHNEATEQHFMQKITTEMALLNISEAQQTIAQFKAHYPQSEQPYICAMDVYFELRSYEQLQQELQQLKASPIRLSNNALKIVRYWNEVLHHNEATSRQ